MSIWDGSWELPDVPLAALGEELLWEDLLSQGPYRLQRSRITGQCRIVDRDREQIALGQEDAMRRRLQELLLNPEAAQPHFGDVIGVHRLGGLYDHYGIFESETCIYEYAGEQGDFRDARVHTTTLEHFTGGTGSCFLLRFPEEDTAREDALPAEVQALAAGIPSLRNLPPFHLYSPEETVRRARSRLGEHSYDLMRNNCEHYAIWCKTGLSESAQVTAFLRAMETLQRLWHTFQASHAAGREPDPPPREDPPPDPAS